MGVPLWVSLRSYVAWHQPAYGRGFPPDCPPLQSLVSWPASQWWICRFQEKENQTRNWTSSALRNDPVLNCLSGQTLSFVSLRKLGAALGSPEKLMILQNFSRCRKFLNTKLNPTFYLGVAFFSGNVKCNVTCKCTGKSESSLVKK